MEMAQCARRLDTQASQRRASRRDEDKRGEAHLYLDEHDIFDYYDGRGMIDDYTRHMTWRAQRARERAGAGYSVQADCECTRAAPDSGMEAKDE